MKMSTDWIVLVFVLAMNPFCISCDRKAEESEVRTVVSQLPSPTGAWMATLDQVEYKSGFTTPDYDRVVLSGAKQTDPAGDVVFIEVRMPESEKPTLAWSDNKLVITISRDADIVPLQKPMDRVQIEVIRRTELRGVPPIGALISALQDTQRTWSRDDLTAKVLETCRGHQGPVSNREIAEWVKLLDIDRPLKTDSTLFAGIQVREVALRCIEELAGTSFYPTRGQELPMRGLLATARGGKPEQFRVVKINSNDVHELKKSIQSWLEKKATVSQ